MKYMKKSFSSMKPYHSELILDGIILNANESPVEPPKKVVDEIKKAASAIEFNRYPDMDENDLDLAIAKHYGIEKENVTVGVGSDELLDVMFRATLEVGDTVLGFSPSFSMYQVFTELVGAKYIPVYGDENYIFHVEDMITAIKEYNPKLVLICTPNNPTGQYLSKA
ncbi:MAG: aminotransferase class I/II-fold pyridoxal phosphate-dependent enzyme, partial [Acholeplasmatales bacterium]|nr:aminotransferase class I/II-fold pyridoxal phosphate-dependent enzyme [Acholeplasmatales bacterium]